MNKNWIVLIGIILLIFGGGFFYRYKINGADERGATKLMRSFEEEVDQQKVLRLIRHTDNINERDKAGRTALFYAVQNGADEKLIDNLLRLGADVTITDKTGQTVLITAARYSTDTVLLSQLLEAGAPINAADNDGYTALTVAARYNMPAVVKKLLRAGADPDIRTHEGKKAEQLLRENEKFSEEEKADFALALKVLSIIGPHPRVAEKIGK